MELENLIEHIERWNKKNVDKLLKNLERYTEDDESVEGGPESTIQSIRKAIIDNKQDGKDVTEEETKLTELEVAIKQLQGRDK